MITLESIKVFGKSTAGNFSGELPFKSGLQVISADNSFGKSLSVTTVAWCLGAETVFGLPENDASCFPLAVREEIEFNGKSYGVISSSCAVTILHKDGKRLRLTRSIKGDCAKITADEIAKDMTMSGTELPPCLPLSAIPYFRVGATIQSVGSQNDKECWRLSDAAQRISNSAAVCHQRLRVASRGRERLVCRASAIAFAAEDVVVWFWFGDPHQCIVYLIS